MKIYTFYTDSHEKIFKNYFLKTLPDELDIISVKKDQISISGDYLSLGWIKTMIFKIDLILRAINENLGSYFIYSDCDIQFFDGFYEDLNGLINGEDLIFQRGSSGIYACAGFIVIKSSEKTKKLFLRIKELMLMSENPEFNDEYYLNELVIYKNIFALDWTLLPVRYYTPGIFVNDISWRWEPKEELIFPRKILLHHANWTLAKNKEKQLRFVQKKIYSKRYSFTDDMVAARFLLKQVKSSF